MKPKNSNMIVPGSVDRVCLHSLDLADSNRNNELWLAVHNQRCHRVDPGAMSIIRHVINATSCTKLVNLAFSVTSLAMLVNVNVNAMEPRIPHQHYSEYATWPCGVQGAISVGVAKDHGYYGPIEGCHMSTYKTITTRCLCSMPANQNAPCYRWPLAPPPALCRVCGASCYRCRRFWHQKIADIRWFTWCQQCGWNFFAPVYHSIDVYLKEFKYRYLNLNSRMLLHSPDLK